MGKPALIRSRSSHVLSFGFSPATVKLLTSTFPLGYGLDSSRMLIVRKPASLSVFKYSSRVTDPAQHSETATGSFRYSSGTGVVA